MQGFFSYATLDWDANEKEISALVDCLSKQIKASGLPKFEMWQDRKKLRWCEDWKEKIKEEIGNTEIFVVALSPAWLGSDMCRQEFQWAKEKLENGKKIHIFVAEIRKIPDDIAAQYSEILNEIAKGQYKKWQFMLTAKVKEINAACLHAAQEVYEVVVAPIVRTKHLEKLTTTPITSEDMPPRGSFILLEPELRFMSGGYFLPSSNMAEDGEILVYLKLTCLGPTKIKVGNNTVYVWHKSAKIIAKLDEGRLARHQEFTGAPKKTKIDIRQDSSRFQMYWLESEQGPLKGNVLTNDPSGETPFVLIKINDGKDFKLSIRVSSEVNCHIENDDNEKIELSDVDREKMNKMQKFFVKNVIEAKAFKSRIREIQ